MSAPLTPTHLANHLACSHLTQLDRALREGRLSLRLPKDPRLEALFARGLAHEERYVASLRASGRTIADLREERSAEATFVAMRAGHGAVVQAPLEGGGFRGRADVLLRVERRSALGAWSYEPADTKLALETRAGTILQLLAYCELLAAALGAMPEGFVVVTPLGAERWRTSDFGAYFRLVRARLVAAATAVPVPATYPDPVLHCDVCRYWLHCEKRRRDDDHLSLVAGMRASHVRELQRQGTTTLASLAATRGELAAPPQRGDAATFRSLARQAALQLRARHEPRPPFEALPVASGRGLARLPEPSEGDVFLDFEGDPFVAGGGREYLTGWAWREGAAWHHRQLWAWDAGEEKSAFEAFVDFVHQCWRQHARMHVYHFGAYEAAALRRLAARHGTRGAELDELLRGERLVDLLAVVREGLRIGVESYGLKELERVSGFSRRQELRAAAAARREVELGLELGLASELEPDLLTAVADYNREDCLSAATLRDWLEARRAEGIAAGSELPRPEPADPSPTETVLERDRKLASAADALLAGVPADAAARDAVQQGRWLLAQLLGYFRREEKCAWWEHYRLRDLDAAALLDERDAIALLRPVATKGSRHRYEFPPQETAIEVGDTLFVTNRDDPDDVRLGKVVALDLAAGTVEIEKAGNRLALHPAAVLRRQVIPAGELEEALLALARALAAEGAGPGRRQRAARDLLLRLRPRRRSTLGSPLRGPDEDALAAAVRACAELDGGVLPIQGPPGCGKTHLGARAILALVAAGKRVGVTAVGHKVIDNLLLAVRDAAREQGRAVRLLHKDQQKDQHEDPRHEDDAQRTLAIEYVDDNDEALSWAARGAVVGGTAWLWSRAEAEGKLDFLFVDEAGQMSLAMALAAARSARNVVLLGDPQQLEQPRKGAHPDGADVAALVHVLGAGRATLAPDQGLFLEQTWRLCPSLCAFTSELYYDGRLEPAPGCASQVLLGDTPFAGAGLFAVETEHRGNQARSAEEVAIVERVVRALLRPGVRWVHARDGERPLTAGDLLVIAPYNAQVGALRARLQALGVDRVGTVDRFQGQEAAVVVYSCTSSSPEDAPRGMTFLYDPHRLNVATSRARCAAIVVASPALFEPSCRTPEQMRWANGMCRLRELARRIELTA